jgi:hypothetical protein
MPLSFSAEEMDLLLSLAQPIDQPQRTQFLTEVTTAIEEEAARTSVGLVHRVARTVQRRFFDPPQLPNASKAARA